MSPRNYRQYESSTVIVAFGRQGVPISTMARALVIDRTQVERVCRRAVESGEIAMMPPATPDSDERSASLAEVINLRATLEDTQQQLREAIGQNENTVSEFMNVAHLTGSEARILGILVNKGRVTKQHLYNCLYATLPECEQAEPKIVDVFICKLRKKLAPHDVSITTLWGQGYEIDAENVNRLKHLRGRHVAGVAPEYAEAA